MKETFEPTKDSMAAVRAALEHGKTITVLDAVRQYGTVDLRKIISRLRRQGMNIADKWLTNEESGKRFKEYFIPPSPAPEANI